MNNDKLLHELANVARGDRNFRDLDPRLERLSAGTLSAEEEAELSAWAETSEEANAAYEAFRPLGASFRAGVVEKLRDRAGLARPPGTREGQGSSPETPAGATVLPFQWRKFLVFGALAASLLAILAVGSGVLPGRPAIPDYEAALTGGLRLERSHSTSENSSVFTQGSPFEVSLKPVQKLDGEELHPKFYLEVGGELTDWAPEFLVSDGSFKITGKVGEDLIVGSGDQAVWAVVARPGRLPSKRALWRSRSKALRGRDWLAKRLPLRVENIELADLFRVEFTGCWTVLEGPSCVLGGSRQLTLWIETPPGADLSFPGLQESARSAVETSMPSESIAEGKKWALAVPQDLEQVEVRATWPGGGDAWRLPLAVIESFPWRDEIQALTDAKRWDEADRRLDAVLDQGPSLYAEAMVRHEMEILAGKRRDGKERLRLAEVSRTAFRDAGDVQWWARKTALLLHFSIQEFDFVVAEPLLEELEATPAVSGEIAWWTAYYRAMKAEKQGNYETALASTQEAGSIAERLGMDRRLWMSEQQLGTVWLKLGRFEEATALLKERADAAEGLDACDRALHLTNYGWSLLAAREAGKPFENPSQPFDRALELYEECGSSGQIANALINQSLAHFGNGKLQETWASLARLEAYRADITTLQLLWFLELKGRVALGDEGFDEAQKIYERLLVEATESPEGRWRALLGTARARAAAGSVDEAIESLRRADSLVDEESLDVPRSAERNRFVGQREEGTRFLLDLLVARGDLREASDVARRSGSRALRSFVQEDRLLILSQALTLCDETLRALEGDPPGRLTPADRESVLDKRLAPCRKLNEMGDAGYLDRGGPRKPDPGELILVFHPLSEGWMAFAVSAETVTTQRFDLPEAIELGNEEGAIRLLEPFRDAIERADRLRILPYGPLRATDFQQLLWGADVLGSAKAVVYGFDLEPSTPVVSPDAPRAVLIGNPDGSLPFAEREVESIGRVLIADGWSVKMLLRDNATAEAVSREIESADLLHFAGHGDFSGRDGWDSELKLAGGSRLGIARILALERVPAWVSLAGCETALSADKVGGEGLGLAQAFLIAGSRQVLASKQSVSDQGSPEFFEALYADWIAERDFGLSLRERIDQSGFSSYRIFER